MNVEIVDGLRKLGLTEYEARSYAALVGLGEATAREVHEASGVPRTRVYDILKDLTGKGFAEFVQGSPTYYRAIEPERVIERLKEELLEAASRSADELKNLNLETPVPTPVWCVRNEWGIKNRVRDIIKRADDELTIFCRSPEFLREHRSDLLSDLNEGCSLVLIVDKMERFADLGLDLRETEDSFAEIYRDVLEDGVDYSLECTMIADGKESIVIYKMGDERQAVMVKLPIVSALQKGILEHLA
ncbi:MAG TPA: TrmB family transcriptional regulator [Methanothrix sp.]|mgnify:CR=1 FL=1|nr:TrmB family transcriptional regulator [Methanothrix sp.]